MIPKPIIKGRVPVCGCFPSTQLFSYSFRFLNLTLLRSKSLHFKKCVEIRQQQVRSLPDLFSYVFLKINTGYYPALESRLSLRQPAFGVLKRHSLHHFSKECSCETNRDTQSQGRDGKLQLIREAWFGRGSPSGLPTGRLLLLS